ncbi:ATP-dependent RNA helicase eIF4A [Cocos nucifera]|uniref:ATP-dependent RNA helicase eIF4A n=1 Tax=Cocos nucifera TaxID=13894 RepID=A0A8K0HZD9_COCNU|nr:ATP-dependent RNA helicase eIF4A [Cocos nucifera]
MYVSLQSRRPWLLRNIIPAPCGGPPASICARRGRGAMRGTATDLPEALPSPSPPSSSSHFSPGRHYYVAVDRLQFKMETLVDLLGVAGRRPSLPMVICCSSRDELDAVCASVSNLSFISLSSLYSDLAECERALVLEKFRHSTVEWSQINNAHPGDDLDGNVADKSCMIVVTDVCLPLVASGEAPLLARILINYELPTKKETYLRRMSTCLAADGIVINMVVGGEVVALKGLEESNGLVIAEMPINISEIL